MDLPSHGDLVPPPAPRLALTENAIVTCDRSASDGELMLGYLASDGGLPWYNDDWWWLMMANDGYWWLLIVNDGNSLVHKQ